MQTRVPAVYWMVVALMSGVVSVLARLSSISKRRVVRDPEKVL